MKRNINRINIYDMQYVNENSIRREEYNVSLRCRNRLSRLKSFRTIIDLNQNQQIIFIKENDALVNLYSQFQSEFKSYLVIKSLNTITS